MLMQERHRRKRWLRSPRRRSRGVLRDLAYGAVGGIAGTYAMKPVTGLLYRWESEEKRKLEESLRREEPFFALAGKLVETAGRPATPERKEKIGKYIHWSYGIAWGALYGILHDRLPAISRGGGLLFGVGFFLVGDELANSLMGLTAPPRAFPPEAHLRGLAGHLAFAAAADATYHGFRKTLG